MTRDMDPLTLLLTNTDAIVEVKAYWQFVSAWLHVNRHVCSNEVLFIFFFTRYTIVMIYYAFSLLLMMLARPIVSYNFTQRRGTKSIYAALYFHPVLIVLQAVLSGLLCKSFTNHIFVLEVFLFNSPEPKGMSFSDRNSSVVPHQHCYRKFFTLLLSSPKPLRQFQLNLIGTNYSWVKRNQVYSNEVSHPFPREVNIKIVKLHQQIFNICFSRTKVPVSTKLKVSLGKGNSSLFK